MEKYLNVSPVYFCIPTNHRMVIVIKSKQAVELAFFSSLTALVEDKFVFLSKQALMTEEEEDLAVYSTVPSLTHVTAHLCRSSNSRTNLSGDLIHVG